MSKAKDRQQDIFLSFLFMDPHIFLQIFIFVWLRFLLSSRILSLSITVCLSLCCSIYPSVCLSISLTHSQHLDTDSPKSLANVDYIMSLLCCNSYLLLVMYHYHVLI